MGVIESIIDFREIIPGGYDKKLELVPVFAIEVLNKNVSKVIELTSHIRNEQLRDLMHIRLCKKLSSTTVAVAYGTNALSQEENNKLVMEGIEIINHLASNVSKNPPRSKKQLMEWSRSWPLIFHKPSWEPKIFTETEKLKVLELMNRSIEVGLTKGDKGSGCIITYNGEIIAEEGDKRAECPLNHVAMVAISRISDSNRKCRKNGTFPEYLCTGCDVYLSNEPCAMCAMALIHSRVSNVFYGRSDNTNGALTSKHHIHKLKPLNHSYRLALREVSRCFVMRFSLSPILNFLGGLESLHVAYSNKRLDTAGIARRMIIMVTGNSVKNRFPHLKVTWEILDYDSPARIEVKTLSGKFESFVIEGFVKSKRLEILDNWKFNSSLDPFPEVLAPKIPGTIMIFSKIIDLVRSRFNYNSSYGIVEEEVGDIEINAPSVETTSVIENADDDFQIPLTNFRFVRRFLKFYSKYKELSYKKVVCFINDFMENRELNVNISTTLDTPITFLVDEFLMKFLFVMAFVVQTPIMWFMASMSLAISKSKDKGVLFWGYVNALCFFLSLVYFLYYVNDPYNYYNDFPRIPPKYKGNI